MQRTRISIIVSVAILGFAAGQSIVHAWPVRAGQEVLQAEQDPPAAAGQTAPAEQQTPATPATTSGVFSAEQLEQLVAPIALYPDSLLMQILMSSTYPLEVVEADRFIKKNPELKGEALDEALKEQDWDPSVKSLCQLPDVLKQMSENLDWTQDLGDAVLGQKTELMDTVQKMRGLAHDAGNLESTEQQTVTQQEDKIIVIESKDPEVVYVPTYSSTVVYGSWGYPSYYYPPMYPVYPPGYGFVSFSIGVAIGAAFWGGCNWGWGHSDIDIDINRYNDFNRNTSIDRDRTRIDQRQGGREGKAGWQHDSSHRKGVNYRSSDVAQNFGGREGSSRVTRDQARGRATASTGARTPGSSQALNRDVASPRTSNSRNSATNRASSRSTTSDFNRSGRSSAMSGSRSPSMDRSSSFRGASSRGTRSFGGGRGGGRPRRR